jgi:hypothetical protein
MMIRGPIVAMALAGALLGGWALPAGAQSNGLIIENNGVDSSHSAAGADNVRVSYNPGNAQSNNGAGGGNQVLRAEKEPKERNRKNRNAPEAAPAEAAPAADEFVAYEGDTGYTEPAPVAAPEELAVAAPQDAATNVLVQKLPDTGTGVGGSLPLTALASALAAVAFGAAGARRRGFI